MKEGLFLLILQKQNYQYYEQWVTNKMYKLYTMAKFLETHNLKILNHEEKENRNRPGISKEI